jgi:hypothetical protein
MPRVRLREAEVAQSLCRMGVAMWPPWPQVVSPKEKGLAAERMALTDSTAAARTASTSMPSTVRVAMAWLGAHSAMNSIGTAQVPLAWQMELGADGERLNSREGAIALGHPLGASGARNVSMTLRHLSS